MNVFIEQLIESMQRTEVVYKHLFSIVQQERSAALASDVRSLVAATNEKERVLCRIKELDLERNRLVNAIAAHLQLSGPQPSMSTIVQWVEPFYGSQLNRLNDTLKNLLNNIRQVNKESRLIIRHCLTLVQNSLSFFNFWTTGSTVYGASGTIHTDRSGGSLVSNSA